MFSEAGMEEAVCSHVFVDVVEGQFVAAWVFLEDAKGMTDADAIVRSRQ